MRALLFLVLLPACASSDATPKTPPGATANSAPESCDLSTAFVDPGGTDWLFDPYAHPDAPDGLLALQLCIDAARIASLGTTPTLAVSAALETPTGRLGVSVSLKGKEGSSFQPIDSKAYFRLTLPDGAAAVRHLRLYNLWQDVGQVQGYLAYQLWRDADYPAPRMGFATVRLNGRDLGLYGVLEEIDEEYFAARPEWFPEDGNLYEGEYGADLTAEAFDDLEPEWLHIGTELPELVNALEGHEGLLHQSVGVYLDAAEWARYWALEVLVGAQEGYTQEANNYYLFEAPAGSGTRFTMLPWGFDMALHTSLPLELPLGVLAKKGLSDAASAELLRGVLACEVDRLDWAGAAAEMTRILPLLEPVYLRQFSPESGFDTLLVAEDITAQHAAIARFLTEEPERIRDWLGGEPCPGG